jgi:enoyl-CoA hydratase/carnithine racemase
VNTEALVIYEVPSPGVARLTVNRPGARNAQNLAVLHALDDQFTRAMREEDVRVIILAAAGPDFSAGHDLRQGLGEEDAAKFGYRGSNGNFSAPAGAGYLAREDETYLQLSRRWRNLTKPTIAQVHGRCIAGGLILAWVCDLIVASEDATFVDPVVAWGGAGIEYFAYPWELGPRKAKEFLFTGDVWTAQEAWRLGMVNHVVPPDQLGAATLALAAKIATKPAFALRAAKQSVNAALDAQGQANAMDTAFHIHHLTHFHNQLQHGGMVDPSVMPPMWTPKTLK